jgi:hypothetical protein
MLTSFFKCCFFLFNVHKDTFQEWSQESGVYPSYQQGSESLAPTLQRPWAPGIVFSLVQKLRRVYST